MSDTLIMCIGFLAQMLFLARFLVQWLLSEKAQRVVTPTLFWSLSLWGSILLFIYGFLRNDVAIMLGQLLTYYIYIRNLQLQNQWNYYSKYIQWGILSIPIISLLYILKSSPLHFHKIIIGNTIASNLLFLGIVAHILFASRFIYQWLYAEHKGQSHLPKGFWYISILGAFLILVYGYYRADVVLITAHLFGLAIYARNLWLLRHKTLS